MKGDERKLKILFLVNKLKRGGAESVFVNQINYLNQSGFNVSLAVLFKSESDDNFFEDLKIDKTKIVIFDFKNLFDLKKIISLRNFILINNIDILYSTLDLSNNVARLIKMCTPAIKVVVRESGMAERKSWFNKVIDVFLNFYCDRIIAVSTEVQRSLLEYQKMHKNKMKCILNGVEISDSDDFSEKNRIKDEFVVLNVGSMRTKNKGQEGIIKAFNVLSREYKDKKLKLILVGDGEYIVNLKALVVEENIQDQVYFTGSLPANCVKDIYKRADVFVLNSDKEGCPNVLLEAMSHGLPIICTEVGGVGDIIDSGISGFLIHKNDPEDLRLKLRALLLDKDLSQKMGKEARKKIERKFTFQQHIEKIIALFNSL